MPDERRTDPFEAVLADGYRASLEGASRVLLAVSGGADSTALLVGSVAIAGRLGLTLFVGTVDHGLRSESRQEAEAVRGLAESLGLSARVLPISLAGGAGVEARARQARYQALEGLRAELGAECIATAHTRDDQAETLLMRLSRGTALRGAAGIRRRRGVVNRPMLEASREEACAYLRRRGQTWHEDPMNQDAAFYRVRVRQSVLPALTQAAQGPVAQNLAAFASLAAEDDAFLGELAAAALVRLQQAYGLDAVGLGALAGPVRRRVWVRWFEGQGISPDLGMIERAEAALAAGGEATLQGGLRLDARGGWVRVGRPRQESASPALEVPVVALALGESRPWGDYLVGLSAERPSAARWASAIPGAALPLQLRGRSPGDRLPVRGHHRRLQDLLVDAKIPREQRSGLPVVCDSRGSPLWIPGVPALCRHDAKATDVWLWAQRIAEASDEADPGL